MTLAWQTDVERATERLKGILLGISIDNHITEDEVRNLADWLNMHKYLHDTRPFNEIVQKLDQILEDNIVDEEEREEVLELCWAFDKHSAACQCATGATRRLHGVLQGISLDQKVREQEIIGLKNWLNTYEGMKDYWPFTDLWKMITDILEDGVVDDDEQKMLLDYCTNFSETPIDDADIHDKIYEKGFMATSAPVLKPFTAICDRECLIQFSDHSFCFTGPARSGPRKVLHAMVNDLGGIPKTGVSPKLNYLVIGAQSSPCWAYSTYGRKIEKVFLQRDERSGITTILHEDDFLAQAK